MITVQGYDSSGNAISNATRTFTVYYNGPVSHAEDSLLISEIMYNPAVTNASYVEIFNRSTNTTFDLWNYRLDGVDYNFKAGTLSPAADSWWRWKIWRPSRMFMAQML